MNKEKAEMIKLIGKVKPFYVETIAEELYNAGYRKTFTSELATEKQQAFKEGYERAKEELLESGELVSTEWHDEQVLLIKGELDQTHENYVAVLKHNAFLRNELRESKTEAVKEFAEKARERINADYVNGGLNNHKGHITEWDIDELLKEYEK